MKLWKSNLFKKWLLTYLILISISLFFLLGINSIYENNIRENLDTLNDSYLKQMGHIFDDEFASIDRLVYTMGFNKSLLNLLNMGMNLTANDRYDILVAAKNLEVNSRANRLISQLNMFAKKPEFIVKGSNVYYSDYIDLYAKESFNISARDLLEAFEVGYNHRVIRLRTLFPEIEISNNPLIYIQSLPVQFANKPTGAFLVEIDETKMQEIAENTIPNGKLFIYNSEEELIFTNDPQYYLESISLMKMKEESDEIEIKDTKYIKAIKTSLTRNWTYISLVPKEYYFAQLDQIHWVMMLMIIIFFAFNLLIAFYLTNRMYMPVRKMVDSLKEEKEPFDSEYEYIESVIQKSRSEQEKMKGDLDRQRHSLKNNFFMKVMQGYIKDKGYIQRQMENFNITFDDESYQLVVIKYLYMKSSDQKNDSGYYELDVELSQFVIRNVMEEILCSYFNIQMIESEGLVACIIDTDENTMTVKEIEGHLYKTREMLESYFGLQCYMGISMKHQHISALPNAYQESNESLSVAELTGEKKIVFYEDIINNEARYAFSEEQEFHLMHSIKEGNLEQTRTLINEVIRVHLKEQSIQLDYLQCIMFDLLGSILKTVNNEPFYDMLKVKSPIKRLNMATDVEDMKEIVLEVAEFACNINAKHHSEAPRYSIEKQVNDYIQSNYSDVDLNGSKLGEVFDMTPAYLSKLYKKETGYSVLYTLNMIRIDAAKKLLEETDLSISDVSLQVGYLYSNAFIRFFKRHTGITPGQYKALKQ